MPTNTLDNETKIRVCNAINYIDVHRRTCEACATYIDLGEGDLCDEGKAILARNLDGFGVEFPET